MIARRGIRRHVGAVVTADHLDRLVCADRGSSEISSKRGELEDVPSIEPDCLRCPRGERGLRFLDVAVAGALVAQVGPLFIPPLRELLSLQPLSMTWLAVAAVFAILPGLAVAVRRRRPSSGTDPKEGQT